jgi:hypothetical protein
VFTAKHKRRRRHEKHLSDIFFHLASRSAHSIARGARGERAGAHRGAESPPAGRQRGAGLPTRPGALRSRSRRCGSLAVTSLGLHATQKCTYNTAAALLHYVLSMDAFMGPRRIKLLGAQSALWKRIKAFLWTIIAASLCNLFASLDLSSGMFRLLCKSFVVRVSQSWGNP